MPFRIAIRPAALLQGISSARGAASPIPPESLRAAGVVLHLVQGQEVFVQGQANDQIYRLVSGVVRLCRLFKNGRRQIEAFHIAGDVFGFDLPACRSLYAEAVNDCVLISYDRRNIDRLAAQDKSVHRQMLHHAVKNLGEARTHALLLGRRGAGEKLAGFLLDWSRRLDGPSSVPLVMPRQDIADYLGLTIETISRTLTQLERSGVIALCHPREVRILDERALTKLAS